MEKELLKNKFDYELELLSGDIAIDSKEEFKKLYFKYKQLENNFQQRICFSETLYQDSLSFFNCSIFCNKDELEFFQKQIDDFNLIINVFHDNLDHFMTF